MKMIELFFAICAAALFLYRGTDDADQLREIANMVATLAATLLGFLLTVLSIMTAVLDRTLIQNMKKTGHYSIFMKHAYSTCVGLFALLVVALFAVFFDGDWLRPTIALSVLIGSWCLARAAEVGRRFRLVITHLD